MKNKEASSEFLGLAQALRLSEQRYRLAISGSPVVVWECDRDLRYTFMDNPQPPVTDPAQFIGKSDEEILPFDSVRGLIEIKRRVLATGVGERREISLPGADKMFHFEMVVEPIYDSDRMIAGLRGLAIDISEQKRTEETLRSVSAELHQTLHIAGTGLVHCSRDLRYLSANPAYAQFVGQPLEKIIGRPLVDVLGKAAFEIIRPRIERVLCGETVQFEDELPIRGVSKCIRVAYTPDRDASGNVVGWVASIMEITERKRAEEALQRSDERQAFLLKLSDALRPLGDPLDVQEVAARLLGEHLRSNRVGYAEIDGRGYVIRREYVSGVRPLAGEGPVGGFGAALRDAYRNGETVIVNDVSTDPRFTEAERTIMQARQIAAYVGVMLIKGGRLVAAFGANNATPRVWTAMEGALIRDVAERTWEAIERARAEEGLREREQRLRLALDASRAGSWMRDVRTDCVDWDDRFRQLYGFTAEEPGTFEAWLGRVHEEDRRKELELWDQIRDTKTHDAFDSTFRIVRPDGTVSWIQSLGQVHRDADGQIIRMTGLDLDVTERRRAEEALQARRDEERDRTLRKEADEALRRSHAELEQRTLQLRRLASDLTLAEQHVREELAKTLHDGLQQLLFSVGMTLDRAVKGNSQADQVGLLQRARADINEAMEAARTLSVNLFPPVLQHGGLSAALTWLAKRTQEQYGVVVNVTADRRANPEASDVRILLFLAVRELLFNVVKHAHVDRVDIRLEVGSDDAIHIHVADEGVGFDPAVTLHHESHRQVGLGLFSIEERLALFGGRLDIQSAPGKGARFSLTLPRSDLHRLATGARGYDTGWQERLVYDSADGPSKPLRILIADDHVVARAGLRELLSECPALQVVGEAANGVEAISQAMALQPDVIVMDVSMPQMNGIEATRKIRRALPHIQIVGLSTHDDEDSARSMREAGAEAYFTKNEGADRLLNYLLAVQTQAKGAADN